MFDFYELFMYLNQAYRCEKVGREHFDVFHQQLLQFPGNINEQESEENVKNTLSFFLKESLYKNHRVNTRGRTDLVVHHGDKATSPVGILFEAKRPANETEMIRKYRPTCKALQELVLYYFREREEEKNTEIKHLVITNMHQWFIFDEVSAWTELIEALPGARPT